MWNVPILTFIEHKSLSKRIYFSIIPTKIILLLLFEQSLNLTWMRRMKKNTRRFMRTTKTWYQIFLIREDCYQKCMYLRLTSCLEATWKILELHRNSLRTHVGKGPKNLFNMDFLSRYVDNVLSVTPVIDCVLVRHPY